MFEKLRNNSLNKYGLCPSYYLSTPALSSDVMLKMTKIDLELIPHPDMFKYSLKKVQEVEILIFLIDIAKPAINI